jgi:tripartite-type tricarboxylate transporter receptor subunit TctC
MWDVALQVWLDMSSALKKISKVLTCVLFLVMSGWVGAQDSYPSKPVKIIVPYPPGGTTDMVGRMIADQLSKILRQAFVVENIAGAGGAIGCERAAHAAPDGYTLLLSSVGSNAVLHGLDSHLKYDSAADFIHLSQLYAGSNVLVVHPDSPYKTIKELVDFGKTHPGKLLYGYTHASSGHMAMELFKQTASGCLVKSKNCLDQFILGVPYRGGGPIMIDVLANNVPMMFVNQEVALPYIKAGTLRALAITSLTRNPQLAKIPTIAESGYQDFETSSWAGLSVVHGTPKEITQKLEAAIVQAMQSPQVKQRMASLGLTVPPQGARHYSQMVRAEIDRWSAVIRTAGIKDQ